MTQTLTQKMFVKDHAVVCARADEGGCPDAVVEHNGRFYITFGHAGFNTPANNGSGYATAGRARATIRRYQGASA